MQGLHIVLEPMKKLNNLRIVGVKITAEDLNPLRGIEQVVFYRTGIDRKLDAFLSSSQRSFRTAVFERLDEIKKRPAGTIQSSPMIQKK